MNIKVWDDKYTIRSDSNCYKIAEIKQKIDNSDEDMAEKNSNGDYEITVGYVNNIAQCFRLIVEREGRLNKCTTLNGYIKHLEEINKKLETNIKLFSKIVGGPEVVERAMKKVVGTNDES